MQGQRLGAALRRIRTTRRLRQADIAALAGVSQAAVSRLERGQVDGLTLRTVERICAAVDVQVVLLPRWRGGDLDRLLSAAHAGMHEAIAGWFRRRWIRWTLMPEASFSIYGERGVIDLLAWHAESRTLLVIELKTQLVDLNETVGTLDRKRRLAWAVARERGWDPVRVGVWLAVASTRTNRARVAAHETFLRNAFPAGRREVRQWLSHPATSIAAMSLESFGAPDRLRTPPKRVRRQGTRVRTGTPVS